MQPQVHVKSGASCTFCGKEIWIMEVCHDFCGHPVVLLWCLWSGTGLAGASFHFQQPKSTLQQHCMCKLNVPSWDSATGCCPFGSSGCSAHPGLVMAPQRQLEAPGRTMHDLWAKDAQCFYIYKFDLNSITFKTFNQRDWSVGLVAQCNPEISRPVGCFDVTWFPMVRTGCGGSTPGDHYRQIPQQSVTAADLSHWAERKEGDQQTVQVVKWQAEDSSPFNSIIQSATKPETHGETLKWQEISMPPMKETFLFWWMWRMGCKASSA